MQYCQPEFSFKSRSTFLILFHMFPFLFLEKIYLLFHCTIRTHGEHTICYSVVMMGEKMHAMLLNYFKSESAF